MTARIDENTDPRSDYQKSQNTSEAQQYASVVDHSKDQLHDASTSSTSGNHSSIVNGSTLNEDDSLPAGHENATEKTGKLGRLRSLKQKTKHKTKKLLKLDDGDSDEGEALREGDAAVESISSDPAFNPSLLKTEGRTIHSSVKDKTIDSLQFAAKATIHPKEAIKGRATRTAGRFTKAEHPYLSREADNELLRAHADLQGARSSTEGSEDEREARTADQNMTVDKLEIRRHSMKVAWTTSRHVQRVRVAPKGQLKYPERSAFVIKRNAEGKAAKHDWLKWVGYILLYYSQGFSSRYVDDFDDLPFDTDTLRHHVERLVMASGPWQSWLLHVRRVYRWEDPKETAKWFALYLVLWYTQFIVTYIYGYIIYTVVRNHFYPSSVKSLQASVDRASSLTVSATRIGELIDKHGSDNWIEPLMAELGPYLQLQLGDVANMLEVLSNFYHWRSPKKTIASLFFISTCITVCILTDMKFCMKVLWFIIGGAFFLCWPVASRYPKYRYLVSPIKWVLWDIPTDAEWSFQYLRTQAQTRREKLIVQKVEDIVVEEQTSPPSQSYQGNMDVPLLAANGVPIGPERDPTAVDDNEEDWHSVDSGRSILHDTTIASLRCECDGHVGKLVISADDIAFRSSLAKRELWRRPYLELAEMKKINAPAAAKLITTACRLELRFTDDEWVSLGMTKNRDEAFNTILGFSGLQWQNLQPAPRRTLRDRKGAK